MSLVDNEGEPTRENKIHWTFIRDISLFVGGMLGVVHETLISKIERPTLLILYAAMMGLPAFLQKAQPGQAEPLRPPKAPKEKP